MQSHLLHAAADGAWSQRHDSSHPSTYGVSYGVAPSKSFLSGYSSCGSHAPLQRFLLNYGPSSARSSDHLRRSSASNWPPAGNTSGRSEMPDAGLRTGNFWEPSDLLGGWGQEYFSKHVATTEKPLSVGEFYSPSNISGAHLSHPRSDQSSFDAHNSSSLHQFQSRVHDLLKTSSSKTRRTHTAVGQFHTLK